MGKSLGRSWADVQPFLKILEENWYDSMESLRHLKLPQPWRIGHVSVLPAGPFDFYVPIWTILNPLITGGLKAKDVTTSAGQCNRTKMPALEAFRQ